MSLEARVQYLEDRQDALDHAFHENNKILEATHGVVSLILSEQRDMRKEMFEFKKEIKQEMSYFKKEIKQEIQEYQRPAEKRFDKIEEILIQIIHRLDQS